MICKECGLDKAPSLYYSSNKSRCKECVKTSVRANREERIEYYREYDRNRPNATARQMKQGDTVKARRLEDDDYRVAMNRTKQSWSSRNPDKRKAQYTLGNAVRDGKVVRPTSCEHCDSSGKIQGHHWSYLQEHHLDVIWLCTRCHGLEHRRLRALGIDPDI